MSPSRHRGSVYRALSAYFAGVQRLCDAVQEVQLEYGAGDGGEGDVDADVDVLLLLVITTTINITRQKL